MGSAPLGIVNFLLTGEMHSPQGCERLSAVPAKAMSHGRQKLMGCAMRRLPLIAAGMWVLASAAPASAATVLNATWTDACGKTTCFSDKGVYSQTFKASDFSGPVNVSKLLMDRGVLGALDTSTFRITFRLNGQELGSWGNYNMGGIGGETLSFSGFDVAWNPEDGDLELVLALVPPPKPGGLGGAFSTVAEGGGEGAPGDLPETPPGGFTPNDPQALFSPTAPEGGLDALVAGVPEPGAWVMMITGFGLAGALLRRRRAALA